MNERATVGQLSVRNTSDSNRVQMLENGETHHPDMNSHKPTKTGSKFSGLVEKHEYFTMSVKNSKNNNHNETKSNQMKGCLKCDAIYLSISLKKK